MSIVPVGPKITTPSALPTGAGTQIAGRSNVELLYCMPLAGGYRVALGVGVPQYRLRSFDRACYLSSRCCGPLCVGSRSFVSGNFSVR